MAIFQELNYHRGILSWTKKWVYCFIFLLNLILGFANYSICLAPQESLRTIGEETFDFFGCIVKIKQTKPMGSNLRKSLYQSHC